MRSPVKNNINIIISGFGCCKQEIFATIGPIYDIARFGINFVSIPEEADILVFQGFYNDSGMQRLLAYYNRMSEPKWVMAVGKCAIDHNIFCSKSDFAVKIRGKIPVDFYVPGCPPRPEAFIYAILRLIENR